MFAIRKIKDEERMHMVDQRGKISLGEEISKLDKECQEGDDHDEDWTPRDTDGEEEDEPLEYCSNSGEHIHDDNADVEMKNADDVISDAESESDSQMKDEIRQFWLQGLMEDQNAVQNLAMENDRYPAWYNGIPRHVNLNDGPEIVDDMHPLFYPGREDASEHGSDASFDPDPEDSHGNHMDDKLNHWLMGKLGYMSKDANVVEHIAGPGCKNLEGYSGNEISAEEMRGCQTLQCLVQKAAFPNFGLLHDDEEFEKTSRFFLSGLSDHMPSRDYGIPRFRPDRHGCQSANAENCIWQEDEAETYAMPFHPSCFEVFKRASHFQSGKIDVNGLTSWWCLEATYYQFNDFPRDPLVHLCHEQEWKHRRGTAYLVANPLFVPSFRHILEAATETDRYFSPRNGAFSVPNVPTQGSSNYDPFALLPTELRMEIIHKLDSKDIASLRLSSRTFRQLPISYFQRLLLREMPWVWEAWPTNAHQHPSTQMPYSIWATMATAEVETSVQRPEHDLAILTNYIDIVTSEMPELAGHLEEALPVQLQAIEDTNSLAAEVHKNDHKPLFLPPDKTNYFILYTLITRHWHELRGLQNRKRIWRDCEEILKRIERYREEGYIGDEGITENLRDLVARQNREERRRREERQRRWQAQREQANMAAQI